MPTSTLGSVRKVGNAHMLAGFVKAKTDFRFADFEGSVSTDVSKLEEQLRIKEVPMRDDPICRFMSTSKSLNLEIDRKYFPKIVDL